MASKYKLHVSHRVLEVLGQRVRLSKAAHIQLPRHIALGNAKDGRSVELHLPTACLQPDGRLVLDIAQEVDPSGLVASLQPDGTIEGVTERADGHRLGVVFRICRDAFVADVLNDLINRPDPYRRLYDIVPHSLGRKVVIEYSSPNIAKPFHMGHLRSTIIGNFVAKLHEHLLFDVVKINYLGDWGTQMGLLKVGMELSGHDHETVQRDPVRLLFEAYVNANREAEKDPEISSRARRIFQQMEAGTAEDLDEWHAYRRYTEDELRGLYRRLGVEFTEYAWESTYGAKAVGTIVDLLQEKELLERTEDGKQVVRLDGRRAVPLLKSDGSTLYMTRDVAAAVDRYVRHAFDRMLYIVDSSQGKHFASLFGTLSAMGFPWAGRLQHVRFGRICGMSTRKGNVVFLRDVLDEMRAVMERKQLLSPTTKVTPTEATADVLGVSAIIINDLKQRRQRDYVFDWDKATQVTGDTGVRLQYTHCRLWNLEKNCGADLSHNCDASVLPEPEVTLLVQEIARFEEVLRATYNQLEACVLVNYLFCLCSHCHRALERLPVKGQVPHVSSQRLMVFHGARLVLNQGMRVLGLQPLQEM